MLFEAGIKYVATHQPIVSQSVRFTVMRFPLCDIHNIPCPCINWRETVPIKYHRNRPKRPRWSEEKIKEVRNEKKKTVCNWVYYEEKLNKLF